MIRWAAKYFAGIPAMFIDGFLYAALAFWTALGTSFGSDEAAKWVEPQALFWFRTVCGVMAAVFLSIKMFRSTSYSEHLESKRTPIPVLPSAPEKDNSAGK